MNTHKKLKAVTQSEVRKWKISHRKMVHMNLPANQKQRHRQRTNVWTTRGKRGWEELGVRDWHICTDAAAASWIPVATGEEHLVSEHKPRWGLFALQWLESSPQLPHATRMEIGLPWANREEHENPATTREKPRGSPVIERWGPFPLQHLRRNPTFPLEIRNGTWHPLCNAKSSLTYHSH